MIIYIRDIKNEVFFYFVYLILNINKILIAAVRKPPKQEKVAKQM